MRILAIGAHYDDLELGCGGALAKHVLSGDEVFGLIMTDSQYFDKLGKKIRDGEIAHREALEASKEIGYTLIIENTISNCHLEFDDSVNAKLLSHIEEIKPDIVFTHWRGDVHHDHYNLALATLNVCKHIERVLMYRSNWYDSSETFNGCFYYDISDTWEIKERAIKKYKSEMERTGNSWIDYFRNLAENNGFRCGVKYAENFEPVKWLI